jgi:hypothetical protein
MQLLYFLKPFFGGILYKQFANTVFNAKVISE